MSANQATLAVRQLCQTLGVSHSGYYAWQTRTPSNRACANTTLLEKIKTAHIARDQTYGMPRIRAEWANLGMTASRKRIARLMRDNKLAGVSRRRAWCVTTQRNKHERPAPDLVKRQFVVTDINQLSLNCR